VDGRADSRKEPITVEGGIIGREDTRELIGDTCDLFAAKEVA